MTTRLNYRIAQAGVAVALLGVLWATGCSSSSKKKDLPQTIESKVTATQSEPDRVSYIEVSPWSLEPGGTVQVKAGGTQGRTGKVTLKGLAGDAAGREFVKPLTESKPGEYLAEYGATDNLPAGEYMVEVELSGGPSGQAAKLTSSRKLAIVKKAVVDTLAIACSEARATFEREPVAYFEFNRDELTAESQAAVASAAEKLRGLGAKLGKVTIEGHCDERGALEYNLALGARRAKQVQRALSAALGSAVTLDTVSYGEAKPVVPDAASEADHAKNRRAVLELSCK
ncbi:MAG: OmpA family protein [Acidobacteriota bacterium]